MKKENNETENRFMVKVLSKAYHNKNEDKDKYEMWYSGTVIDTISKKEIKFDSPGELLEAMETLSKK